MTEPLPPGATIGILGGGQLGRMLSVAAARLGFSCHIYEPGANPPAAQVAAQVTSADYTDEQALRRFARSVDVITYEFENIPTEALDILEEGAAGQPGPADRKDLSAGLGPENRALRRYRQPEQP